MKAPNQEDKDNARVVSSMVNDFSFNYDGFCSAMTLEHRTLQQCFTKLCIHWLATCASEEYRFDDRNEASHNIAKAIIDSQDADFIGHIPFI